MPRGTARKECRPGINCKAKDDSPYVRGDFWLGSKADSPNFIIYRYNPEKRSHDARSAGTGELDEACKALDALYLASKDQSPAYCPTCGQKIADGNAYSLLQAINDYKIEHASKLVSYEIIRARLAHVIRFVLERHHEDLPCSVATTDEFVGGFREWLLPQPVIWTDAAGKVTASHDRTDSSVEESVHQLRAVLNFAVKKGRSDAKPTFSAKTRAMVTKPVRDRASLDDLARMVDYARQPNLRREGLFRFLVAEICTAARPDAIFDMNVSPDREQYDPRNGFFNLNPFGRAQTKKYRPIIPMLPLLQVLCETASEDGWVVHYYGRRVNNVRTAWRGMIADLELGEGRGVGAYLMRRSMSQLLRESGARPWDVQGLMGHRVAGTTETYTAASMFPTAMEHLQAIIADIEVKIGDPDWTFAVQLRSSNEKGPE
ncbi:tyrosine-type recombinase [Citromicrobium phage vB_CbaS-RXM]|nr:tyrosine-type recombinase [Citromicrobium phage vB_CbaS-RXM]